MAEAPLPANEEARLEALRRYHILDSEPEQAFDDLTALAAQICGTPMALIGFVDQHRQWFKSAHGLSETETPRDVALCAHSILDAAPVVVVPDTQKDPRFAGTPLVVGGARIAGYAAAVLRDGDCALGTLCVMDRQPFSLTAGQKDALGRLAHQVMAQLSLRESVALLKADIQLRTEVERKLAASERLYRDLVDNALGLICTHDMDGTLRMVNPGAEQLLGYARDEMVGRNLREFIPAKHHASFDQYLDAMRRSPQFNGLLSVTARDGRHVTMACQNFRFESPSGPYIVGHGVDVTERAKVNSMNRRFAAVLDVTTDGVTMADSKLRPVYLNRAGREMTGVGLDEDISTLDFLAAYGSGGAADIIKAGVAAAMVDGTWAGENTLRHRDGREIAVSQVVLAPRNAAGDVEFIATIARDISERKQTESSLLRAREDALAASRMKSEFVANMSHEIRTPINGVIGLTMLLLETPLTPEQREYAEGVTQSAEILQTIVNDVLDLSKIEAGKLAIDPFEFELKPMIAGALAPVAVKAQAKQLSIDVHFGPNLPEWVIGDPRHIRQILINLVDNAVKFSERGAIRVAIETVPSVEQTWRIQFSVTDSGVGIPEEKLHCIFEKFTQADSSTTRKFGGTGLGLAICQQLVALMHGEIGATSIPGHGSTFCFTLPLGTKETALVSPPEIPAPLPVQPVQPVQTAQPARPLHVLVVEDNRINQTVAVRRLQNAGCTVEVAENGEVAVRCVDAQHFDIVFMDCQMPVMDGYEATRQIRRRPEHAGLPIVAMTASAMEGDRERCLEAGMTDYLSKPLKAAVVEAVLEGLRRVATATQPVVNAPTLVGILDEAAIRSLFDDDVEAMLELMALVRSDLPKYAARLLTHVEQGEWIEVARVAHTIKGAASNVSGMAVVEAAQAVEHAARGEDVATLPVAAAHLTAAINALVEAMTAWSRRLEASPRADAA